MPGNWVQREREWTVPAKRTYGMDQDFYPSSPIVTRPILRWPDNARVALAVIVNLEHWDWEVPAGTPLAVSPLGGAETSRSFLILAATATMSMATVSGSFASSPCWTNTASNRP
jgi:hypothetical protein